MTTGTSDKLYLGHTITEDGKCDIEIRKRINTAKSTFINMKSILTSKQITNKLKMGIVKCYVDLILHYGAQSWKLNKLMEDKIIGLQNVGIQTNMTHLMKGKNFTKGKKTNKAIQLGST
jgi:hypothetical protein